jgi:hypothetical protein
LDPKTLTGALEAYSETFETHFGVKSDHGGTKMKYWSSGDSSLEVNDNPGAIEGHAGAMQYYWGCY